MQLDRIGMTSSYTGNQNISTAKASQENNGPEIKTRPQETAYREEVKYTEDELIGMIERANKELVAYDTKFEFSIHEKTKQIMVKVVDSKTSEVIKELPPEKVLDIVAGLWEVAGLIVDKKI